jgi:hypothetical protein
LKLDVLEFLEQRLSDLIEKPLERFFPVVRADQLLAKRLVKAMSDDLSVDNAGRLVAPVCYELRINPLHTVLWSERPGLLAQLTEALQQAAREQGIAFESLPVIDVVFDNDVAPEDIQVTTLELGVKPGTTAETTVASPDYSAIPEDAFLIINGGRHLALTVPVLTIGRAETNQLVLDNPQVSRVHAQLRAIDGAFHIFDLDSTCGTLVNGEDIHHTALRTGDVIEIGGVSLVYGQESTSVEDTTNLPPIKNNKGKSG